MPDLVPTSTRRRFRRSAPTAVASTTSGAGVVSAPVVVTVLVLVAAVLFAFGAATASATPSPSASATAGGLGAGTDPSAVPTPPRPAATAPPGALVRAGDDAVLRPGETVEAVFVVGGDADVAGTVRTSVVVIGGDAIIRGTAIIGEGLTERDAAIVVVGGKVKESPGAQITGTTQVVSLTAPRIDIAGALWHRISHPGISVTDWFGRTIFYTLVALAVVALFPRPARAVRDHAFAAPLASLGWGALTAFMAGVVALILAATIIGLVVVIPAALLSPFVGLFVYATASFALGDLLLGRIWPTERSRFLAAFTGVVVLGLVSLIPIVGGPAIVLVWLTGLGATALAAVEWRRARQARAAMAGAVDPAVPAPGGLADAPGGYDPGSGPATPPDDARG